MKKVFLLAFIIILGLSAPVYALSWAYPFVVWEGSVYEVKLDITIEADEIGDVIGKVETKPNDMTGEYYGNASNYYPIGTDYYRIKGTSTSSAIAVKDGEHWLKAVYAHKAAFHMMNVLTSTWFKVIVSMIVLGIVWLLVWNVYQSMRQSQ